MVEDKNLFNQSYCRCPTTEAINAWMHSEFPVHDSKSLQKWLFQSLKDLGMLICFLKINGDPGFVINRYEGSIFRIHASSSIKADLFENILTGYVHFPMGTQFQRKRISHSLCNHVTIGTMAIKNTTENCVCSGTKVLKSTVYKTKSNKQANWDIATATIKDTKARMLTSYNIDDSKEYSDNKKI